MEPGHARTATSPRGKISRRCRQRQRQPASAVGMRLSTALRIASILIITKAVLIGAVYWLRAEITYPAIGARGWVGFIVIVAVGITVAAVLYTASRRSGC